jgi:hypothetical protein
MFEDSPHADEKFSCYVVDQLRVQRPIADLLSIHTTRAILEEGKK